MSYEPCSSFTNKAISRTTPCFFEPREVLYNDSHIIYVTPLARLCVMHRICVVIDLSNTSILLQVADVEVNQFIILHFFCENKAREMHKLFYATGIGKWCFP